MKYIILGIIVLVVLYFLVIFNKLTKKKNDVSEAFATMDVCLKKRWDLIPNLVEIVKGYTKYENDTFENIVNARNNYDNLSEEDKLKTNKSIENEITKLFALAESYPELKANQNFLDLSKKLSELENEIADSRKYYNAVVRIYNNTVQMIPSNIVAMICGFKTKEMFIIGEEERNNIKVDL